MNFRREERSCNHCFCNLFLAQIQIDEVTMWEVSNACFWSGPIPWKINKHWNVQYIRDKRWTCFQVKAARILLKLKLLSSQFWFETVKWSCLEFFRFCWFMLNFVSIFWLSLKNESTKYSKNLKQGSFRKYFLINLISQACRFVAMNVHRRVSIDVQTCWIYKKMWVFSLKCKTLKLNKF